MFPVVEDVRGISRSSIVTVVTVTAAAAAAAAAAPPGPVRREPCEIFVPFLDTIITLVGYCLMPEISHCVRVLQP
eukprot:COSAG06_NODE_18349_length_892_cov_0.905422_2_plen_74_part_01